MTNIKVGKVSHYFNKISVAVVEVDGTLKTGDQIKFTGSNEFQQEVASMQVEHQSIAEAKKGDAIGLKVDQPVKEGDEVYKVIEA